MPTPFCPSAAEDCNTVATLPPDEILTWHCEQHTFHDICELCIHCNKWVIPTAQQFLRTLHRTEPRSVPFELLINHLQANRATLTSELEDATTAYVDRQKLTLPVVITAVLMPADGVATELLVMVRVDPRAQNPLPTMAAATDSASSELPPGLPDTPALLTADIPMHVLAPPPPTELAFLHRSNQLLPQRRSQPFSHRWKGSTTC